MTPLTRTRSTAARPVRVRERSAGGASDQATTALKQIYGRDQIAKVETRDGFAADKSKWLSAFLNMIYVLLALSVIVSLFGIVTHSRSRSTSGRVRSGCCARSA